jgi:hypothetical protein
MCVAGADGARCCQQAWPIWQALHDLLVLHEAGCFHSSGQPPSVAEVEPEPEPQPGQGGDGGGDPIVLVPQAADSCAAMRDMWAKLRALHGGDNGGRARLSALVRSWVCQ